MKYGKKILAILLIALMLLSLSACGLSDIPVIKGAVNFIQLTSVHAVPECEVGVTVKVPAYGMSMDFDITADGAIDYCCDPLCFSADLNLNLLDESQRVLAYGEDVNGDFVVEYSLDGGVTWEQTTLAKTDDILDEMDQVSTLGLSDLIDLGKQIGDMLGGFTKVGQEPVNGAAAARYDAPIRLSVLLQSEAAQEALLEGMAESAEMDAAAIAELFDPSSVGDATLSLWLDDKSGNLVKAQLDLTEALRSLVESGLISSLVASEAGLDGTDFSLGLDSMRMAVTLSEFDSVGEISRPSGMPGIIGGADGPTSTWGGDDAALTEGSTWHGSYEIRNHAGKGELTNGSTEVWGLLGTSGERLFFELYSVPDFTGSTKPLLSCWARVEGNRIIPEIGEEDAWFLNIYLTENDRDAMSFTLEDGVLGTQYFYYDSTGPEACDVIFTLTPFA